MLYGIQVANVLPVNDLKEHIETPYCWCEPLIEYKDGVKIIIHNSLDGREFYENEGH